MAIGAQKYATADHRRGRWPSEVSGRQTQRWSAVTQPQTVMKGGWRGGTRPLELPERRGTLLPEAADAGAEARARGHTTVGGGGVGTLLPEFAATRHV